MKLTAEELQEFLLEMNEEDEQGLIYAIIPDTDTDNDQPLSDTVDDMPLDNIITLPCIPNGKKAACLWKALTDSVPISGKQNPAILLNDNLIVIDVDNPDLFAQTCAKHPQLAELISNTLTVYTASGKHHYYYVNSGPARSSKNINKTYGCEIRTGSGHYMLAPGAKINGKSYTHNGVAPKTIDVDTWDMLSSIMPEIATVNNNNDNETVKNMDKGGTGSMDYEIHDRLMVNVNPIHAKKLQKSDKYKEGDTNGRSLSEDIYRLTCVCRLHEMTDEETHNVVAHYIKTQHRKRRSNKYIANVTAKTDDYLHHSQKSDVRQTLHECMILVQEGKILKMNEQMMLKILLIEMIGLDKYTIDISLRSLAEKANMTAMAARKIIIKLSDRGLITYQPNKNKSSITVNAGAIRQLHNDDTIAKKSNHNRLTLITSDMFAAGNGFGKTSAIIIDIINSYPGIKRSDLVRIAIDNGMCRVTAYNNIAKLIGGGFVKVNDNKLTLSDNMLTMIRSWEQSHEIRNSFRKKVDRHKKERDLYHHDKYARVYDFVVDKKTGEMIEVDENGQLVLAI